MGDLSTAEYLYDLRCMSASSDTHSAMACSAHVRTWSSSSVDCHDTEGPKKRRDTENVGWGLAHHYCWEQPFCKVHRLSRDREGRGSWATPRVVIRGY